MAAPVVSNISNLSGTPGVQVRVAGTDLDTVTDVVFGGGVSATILSKGPGYLTFEVPTGAQSGVITITNPDGSVQTSSFTVLAPIQPPLPARQPRSWKLNWVAILALLGAGVAILISLMSRDLSDYAKTEDVNNDLAKKADKEQVDKLDTAINDKDKGIIVLTNKLAENFNTLKTKVNDPTTGLEALANKVNDPTTGLEALANKVNDPTTGLDTKIDEAKAKKILAEACAEREAEKKKQDREWWKKHGPKVIANRESEKLQERELIKTELLKELQKTDTTVVLPGEGDPDAVIVDVKPYGGKTERAIIPRVIKPAPKEEPAKTP